MSPQSTLPLCAPFAVSDRAIGAWTMLFRHVPLPVGSSTEYCYASGLFAHKLACSYYIVGCHGDVLNVERVAGRVRTP